MLCSVKLSRPAALGMHMRPPSSSPALPRQGVRTHAEYSPDPRNRPGPVRTGYEPWRQVGAYDYPPSPAGNGGPPRPPPPQPPEKDDRSINEFTKALLAASFVIGLGMGVFIDSEVTLQPTSVASTAMVDMRTPNSEICLANGYSAMVFDQRIFVSFNPFNVYVAQPSLKPGCVLRAANTYVLEQKNLVTRSEVDSCKRSMNFFAWVGDLAGSPEVDCVYHSEDAENEYLQKQMTKDAGWWRDWGKSGAAAAIAESAAGTMPAPPASGS